MTEKQKTTIQQRQARYIQTKHDKFGKKGKGEKPRPTLAQFSAYIPDSFLGIPCVKKTITIPSKEERKQRRAEFEKEARTAFIKKLAKEHRSELLAAGITKNQIRGMECGQTPHGFNTHHKIPIFAGGTNDFSNLMLIRREPYHDMVHYHVINPQLNGMTDGDSRKVSIPISKSCVYVPPREFKYLEKRAKKGEKSYGKDKKFEFDFKNNTLRAQRYLIDRFNGKKAR